MKDLNLTAKEKRLADLLEKTDGDQLNIGYACKQLHTTPRTLLSKTLPGLRAKLEAQASEFEVAQARKAAGYDGST